MSYPRETIEFDSVFTLDIEGLDSIDCHVQGSAVVIEETDYGADRDGNRGISVCHVDDVEIDFICYIDDKNEMHPVPYRHVRNKDVLFSNIRDLVIIEYRKGK